MSTRPFPTPAPRGSLLRALAVQSRVIGALILRELHTRYGRENIGYLWLFGEPMILASIIGLMHANSGHSAFAPDIKPLPFGVLGYICFILFRGIVNRAEGSIEANAPLLYHRQVTVLDLVIARSVLEFCGCFATFAIMMTLLVSLGFANPPARPLAVVAAWGLMFWYAFGQALIIAAITYKNHTIGRLVHQYTYFMVGLSGAFLPIGWIPRPFRDWLTWLPITSVFEGLRYGWFVSAKPEYFFPLYLAGSCLVLTWVGMIALTLVRDKIHLS